MVLSSRLLFLFLVSSSFAGCMKLWQKFTQGSPSRLCLSIPSLLPLRSCRSMLAAWMPGTQTWSVLHNCPDRSCFDRAIRLLCCAVLCFAVPCCDVLCCAVLCCAVLCCAVVQSVCCDVMCCAVLCCAVLRVCSAFPVLCCATLCSLSGVLAVHNCWQEPPCI